MNEGPTIRKRKKRGLAEKREDLLSDICQKETIVDNWLKKAVPRVPWYRRSFGHYVWKRISGFQ